MSYQPPARRGGNDTLKEAASYGVKWPKEVKEAIAADDLAREYVRQAQLMAQAGRVELDAEWVEARAKHDIAEALAKAPAEFEPYSVPRPDVEYLNGLRKVYDSAQKFTQRNLDAALGDYPKLFSLLDTAWRKLPAIDPTTMTVAEAAGIEASSEAARAVLRNVNLALVKVSGQPNEVLVKVRKMQASDPSRLADMRKVTAAMYGKSAEAKKADADAAKAEAEKRAADKAYAIDAAQRRRGTKAEATA